MTETTHKEDTKETKGVVRTKGGGQIEISVRGVANADWLLERSLRLTQGLAAIGPIAEAEPSVRKLIGRSDAMQALYRILDRVRTTEATVLVLGENGTGKELVAKCIHTESKRGHKAFVAANCSAFNDNLLESEMFGHKRGAFTGAGQDKIGLFESAHGGTFFMDEVGEMSAALQVKLLRVLQEGTFMPVGGTQTKKVDVRIIAATNRELTDMVKKGSFREDLLYRLNVVMIRVPPLRERKDDIPLLVQHFLTRLTTRYSQEKVMSEAALQLLQNHNWPGNVRELENEVERLWVLSGHEPVIDHSQLPTYMTKAKKPLEVARTRDGDNARQEVSSLPPAANLPEAVELLERKMIADALLRSKGNKTRAALELGVSRRNLIRKVQGYSIEIAREGDESDEVDLDDEIES